jgi:hypothetical protein
MQALVCLGYRQKKYQLKDVSLNIRITLKYIFENVVGSCEVDILFG